MLVISEILRLVGQTVGYAVNQRRFGLLFFVVIVGILVAITAAASAVVPVAIYPFL